MDQESQQKIEEMIIKKEEGNKEFEKQLFSRKEKSKKIVRDIEDIKFTNLKNLTINYHQAQSIEGISRIWMPLLQKLWIDCNQITNMRDVVKGNWPSLNAIILRKNKVWDAKQLFKIHTLDLKYMSVEFSKSESEQCYDMAWILKLQSNIFENIRINSGERIRRANLQKVFAKKYPTINFCRF